MRTIKALLVEDSKSKATSVVSLLKKRLNFDIIFDTSMNYEDASHRLKSEYFDLAILDLLLPSEIDPTPNTRTSETLVDLVRSGRAYSRPLLIGLTEDVDTFEEMSEQYRNRLLSLELFDRGSDEWAKRLASTIHELINARHHYLNFLQSFPDLDFLVLTARYESEFSPILDMIKWVGKKPNVEVDPSGMSFIQGLARIGGTQFRVRLLCMAQMGLSSTAAIATRLMMEHRPRYCVMLGMCAGIRAKSAANTAKLLDVMITSEATCWDEGKYSDEKEEGIGGFLYRPDTLHLSEDDFNSVRHLLETDIERFSTNAAELTLSWQRKGTLEALKDEFRETPVLKMGRNVSGTNIVSRSELVEEIVRRNPTALSLEMEIYSVFKAASVLSGFRPKVICIKGVADFGEHKENDLYDAVQPIASQLSYVAFEWLSPVLTLD